MKVKVTATFELNWDELDEKSPEEIAATVKTAMEEDSIDFNDSEAKLTVTTENITEPE